jgi:hypothetical protein
MNRSEAQIIPRALNDTIVAMYIRMIDIAHAPLEDLMVVRPLTIGAVAARVFVVSVSWRRNRIIVRAVLTSLSIGPPKK